MRHSYLEYYYYECECELYAIRHVINNNSNIYWIYNNTFVMMMMMMMMMGCPDPNRESIREGNHSLTLHPPPLWYCDCRDCGLQAAGMYPDRRVDSHPLHDSPLVSDSDKSLTSL